MTNTNRAKEKAPAVQAGQTHAAPIRNAGGMGEEMGHFGCTGYSLDTPARTAAITALVQAMQASVYARSSICGLLGWGGEFRRCVSGLLVCKSNQLCCGLCPAGNVTRFPARDARLVHADGVGNLSLRHGAPKYCQSVFNLAHDAIMRQRIAMRKHLIYLRLAVTCCCNK